MPASPEWQDDWSWLCEEVESGFQTDDLPFLQEQLYDLDQLEHQAAEELLQYQKYKVEEACNTAAVGLGAIAFGSASVWISSSEWLPETIDITGRIFNYLGGLTFMAGAVGAGVHFMKYRKEKNQRPNS